MSQISDLSTDEQMAHLEGIARQAMARWSASGEPQLIKYRENGVYEVDLGGRRAAMRVHRQGYHDQAGLEAELAWMSHLGDRGILVPSPVPDVDGAILHHQPDDRFGGAWMVDVLSWLDGVQLGEIGEPLDLASSELPSLFAEIGQTIARMHSATVGWSRQGDLTRQSWDSDGLVGDQPLWGPFWELDGLDAAYLSMLDDVRRAIAEDLATYGRNPERYGLIHADLVPENVFVDRGKVKLIDFDDAGFGWHMFELATALYWLGEEPDYEVIERSLLDGYQSVRPLDAADLAMLPLFNAARSTTYLGWVHTRKGTETAVELTPIMIELAQHHCQRYLSQRNQSADPADREDPTT